jgi:TPR repeat protein
MYERGAGVPRDHLKAGDLYQMTCTAGVQASCDKAKEMHAPSPNPLLEGGLP